MTKTTMSKTDFVASVRADYLARNTAAVAPCGPIQGGKLGLRALDGREFVAAGPWAGAADEHYTSTMVTVDDEIQAEYDARLELAMNR